MSFPFSKTSSVLPLLFAKFPLLNIMAFISSHFPISLYYNSPTLFLDTLYHDLLSRKENFLMHNENFLLFVLFCFCFCLHRLTVNCLAAILPGPIYTCFLLKSCLGNILLWGLFFKLAQIICIYPVVLYH